MGFFSNLIKPKQPINSVKPNSFQDALNKCKKFNNDTIVMVTARHCSYCSKYGVSKNGKYKIYSVSGKNLKYPSIKTIPTDLTTGTCPKCNGSVAFLQHFEGIK